MKVFFNPKEPLLPGLRFFCYSFVEMKNFLFLCLVLALTIPSSHGSEQIRQVQEELRKRNLYFGEIDGNPSEPLKKALARYQSVKGLAESGAADISTLQSLGMETTLAENIAPLPNVAVLKSDAPRELTDEDRRLAESQVVEALNSPGEGPSEPQATTLFAANSLPGGGDPMEPDPLLTEENVKKFVQD